MPMGQPLVSLAWRAPAPADAPYPAFLVLAARLAARLPATSYPVLDDPGTLFVSGAVTPGETPERAVARLQEGVASVVSRALTPADLAAARNMYGALLGAQPMPAAMLRHNPYGVAFALARREQMGIDGAALAAAWKALSADSLRAAAALLAPERCAAVVVTAGP
jgi:hypothetical protein